MFTVKSSFLAYAHAAKLHPNLENDRHGIDMLNMVYNLVLKKGHQVQGTKRLHEVLCSQRCWHWSDNDEIDDATTTNWLTMALSSPNIVSDWLGYELRQSPISTVRKFAGDCHWLSSSWALPATTFELDNWAYCPCLLGEGLILEHDVYIWPSALLERTSKLMLCRHDFESNIPVYHDSPTQEISGEPTLSPRG